MKNNSLRLSVLSYAKEKYGSDPEYLWARFPGYAVCRHPDSGKWYMVVMNVKRSALGLAGDEYTDIVNVKLNDPLLLELMMQETGFYPGYHISRGRGNWMSVLLDGTVPLKRITALIDTSYGCTASAKKKLELRPPKEWIIPSNPKYYDIESAFDRTDVIEWKQGKSIRTGDTVYMYVGAPVSAVLYKCSVIETGIPCDYHGKDVTITALMRIKLEKRYPRDRFTFAILGEEYGIYAVRGPRGIPDSLSKALNDTKNS